MRRVGLLLVCLMVATTVWAAEPRPMVKSAGELAWAAIPDDTPDEEQVRLAKEYLDKYPTEIPLLRSVQNVLNRKSDLTVEFWKERMDKQPTTANRYLYARKTGDAAIMAEQAQAILRDDATNFWGDYLAAVAEWSKEEPDLKKVAAHFDAAIEKDPSRPEGWGYAAEVAEELKDLDKALRMYQAEAVVKPGEKGPTLSMLGIFAQQRNSEKYFALVSEVLPSEPPLSFQLGMHGTDHLMSSSDLGGQSSVLEMFTYW